MADITVTGSPPLVADDPQCEPGQPHGGLHRAPELFADTVMDFLDRS